MNFSNCVPFMFAVAFCIPQTLTPDDRYADVPRNYENNQYGYTVIIPEGFRGYKPRPPAPVHGFFIPLTEDPSSKIDVDASYNTLEYKSGREAAVGETAWFFERCGADWRTVSGPMVLGPLPAIHTEITCKAQGSSDNLVLENVVAIRQATPDYILAVVYSVNLISAEKRLPQDRRVYEQILRSFQLSEGKR
jgi:hypothetical protein